MQTIGRRLRISCVVREELADAVRARFNFANCCQRGGDHASIGAGSAGNATEAKQR